MEGLCHGNSLDLEENVVAWAQSLELPLKCWEWWLTLVISVLAPETQTEGFLGLSGHPK